MKEEIVQRIQQLEEKFSASGQDLLSYLDGLLYADYLTYWDYVQVDTLLSLQHPKTRFPDEKIFIVYHQITELYFNLALHEAHQIASGDGLSVDFLIARVKRINEYFRSLTTSFEIMIQGMEKEQFLKFRMSLLPASGFQSAQYRKIEIACTDFIHLVDKDFREGYSAESSIEDMFHHIYWKAGATELASGKKTLTLIQFEQKYSKELIELAVQMKQSNVYKKFQGLNEADKEKLRPHLRQLDVNVNINWPLVHYKSAARYLQRNPEDIAATGGTNWQKYLPPRFQRRIFYPELWSEEELANWGKAWVQSTLGMHTESIPEYKD
jgi:tryptophan 2,3-dioxygenase